MSSNLSKAFKLSKEFELLVSFKHKLLLPGFYFCVCAYYCLLLLFFYIHNIKKKLKLAAELYFITTRNFAAVYKMWRSK